MLDRSKYFRGRRIHNDWDVRVEQAEFRELSITAPAENGPIVSMAVFRNGTKVVRYRSSVRASSARRKRLRPTLRRLTDSVQRFADPSGRTSCS